MNLYLNVNFYLCIRLFVNINAKFELINLSIDLSFEKFRDIMTEILRNMLQDFKLTGDIQSKTNAVFLYS